MFNDLKYLYEHKSVNLDYVIESVIRGWITDYEFLAITGKTFSFNL